MLAFPQSLAVRRLAVALTLGAGLAAGPACAQEAETAVSPDPATAEALPRDDQPGQLPLTELRIFADVFNQIRTAYVEEVDDRTLLESAIKGMLNGLDPHSAYLDKDSFADLREHTTGEFGGVGLEVGVDSNGFVRVITPIDDTPASAAGIESGDVIIKLDGKSVKGLGLNDAVNMMRGPKGSKIEMTIMREGNPAPFDVTLTRDVIKVKSVRARLLEPGFGYLRIAQFQNETGADMIAAIGRMQKESKGPLRGVVLDLRNNPGGVLQSSVDVADAFLESGLVVYTEGRVENARSRFSATSGDELGGAPLVVLINGGSASASEIVAGALQDHKRAIVVGTDSFGKGSVQTVLPISEERAIKLTTARYFTPKGRSIQAQGIIPDIVVERAEVTTIASTPRVTEADLARHLSNDNGNGENGSRERSTPKVSIDLRSDDNQLYEALNLLKGIAFTRGSEPPASPPEPPAG
ncbi:MAG: S41 family peptidase [Gammaproteobacteria bacterium]|jgi:carboxyl-terminal processing protease|nr:S41 family peptidase [Gammaproteobacteria bacterium]MBK9469837.1 S41 family peptidase [Gammaproteobacteria bacterium]